MASVGGAAATGLQSGLQMGLQLRDQQLQEEAAKRTASMQDEQLQRQRRADDRLEDDRELEAINKAFEDLRAEGEGLYAQHGRNVPEDIAGPYKQRVGEVSGMRNTLLRKRYEPVLQQQRQRAQDTAMALQSGRVKMEDLTPEDLYHAVAVQTRRDPADLLSSNGKPSRVHAAVTDIMEGLEYGNEGATLRGANVLLEPELKVGVGEQSPHGGTILAKQIVKLVPHPNDPTKVLPVVKVYVRSGAADAAVTQTPGAAEEGAPPGATGYYLAPITENRSSDPDDPPKPIDLRQAMEYAAKMQTLSTALDHPEVRAKLEAGKKGGPGDFLTAFYSVRGKPPAKTPVEYKNVKPGEKLVGIDPLTGKPTGDEIKGDPKPVKEAAPTGLAAQIQAVQDYADENGISEAEAAIQLQQRGLLRTPKAAKGAGGSGGGGGGVKGLSARADLSGEDLLKALPPDEARIVKGLADGTIKPESISTKGNRREHLLALAAQYAPDAGGAGKALPENVRTKLVEVRDNAATMTRLSGSFKDEFASKGVFGLGADKQLAASAVLGVDNDSVQWWKNYRKQAQLIERHAMFGASLTQGEQSAWASADISPGMDAKVIRDNLATREKLTRKVLDATRADLIDAGHSAKRIDSIANRDMSIDTAPAGAPKPPPAPKAGQAAPTNAKGWRLMTDAKGNRAYVSPDGKSFEEIR